MKRARCVSFYIPRRCVVVLVDFTSVLNIVILIFLTHTYLNTGVPAYIAGGVVAKKILAGK